MQLRPVTDDYALHLDDVDMCAASCGMTVRTPIADVDVWEYALSLPPDVKYPTTLKKGLVRRAMRGRVPDVILDRRDKTLFDSHGLDLIDYSMLERWTLRPKQRLDGIDYRVLEARISNRQVGLVELDTIHTLARIHAFLEQW